jgi:DNA-binding NtrC family response regulator
MKKPKRYSKKSDPRAGQTPREKASQRSESDRTFKVFLSNLRHELRTPLDAIISYSEGLIEDSEKQGQSDFIPDLMKIRASSERLLALVNDVLDPGKLEAMQTEHDWEEFGADLRHELRTPLNAIIGYSEMLLEDAGDKGRDSLTHDLRMICSAARQFLALIEDIVNFPYIKTGVNDLDPGTSSQSSMIKDVMSTIPPLEEDERAIVEVNRGSLLVVDDNETNRDLLTRYLERQGHKVTTAENGHRALEIIKKNAFDLLLLDIMMPEMNGYQVLQHLKSSDDLRDIPVIVISALDEMDSAVRCIQAGAEDYLLKPFNPVLLGARIKTCLEKKRLKELNEALELRNLREEVQFIAESRAMQNVLNTVRAVCRNPVNVFIYGDSGTGKEVIARMIHTCSDRKEKTFVAVNCASIPENLMESEFFGYEKGAFSGAVSSRGGRFEEADGGTLFLDEIGDMPLAIQPKFLRVIQEGEGSRLGSSKPISYDLRIISATNRDIREEVASGRFREDLFYRLFSVEIHIPPLRERREDIVPLAIFFINKVSKRFKKKIAGFSPGVLNFFEEYPWPGNVRELLREVERLVTLTPEGHQITLKHCSQELQNWRNSRSITALQKQPDRSLPDKIKEVEITCIKDALRETGGNKLQASKLLGISRHGLDKKIKRYKISSKRRI